MVLLCYNRPMRVSRSWLGFVAVLAVAAGLRLWQIDTIPPGFHFDEAFEGLEAWRIWTDPSYRPVFLAGNFGVAPANAYANAWMFGLFGWFGGEPGPVAMRVTAALFGVLGVAAVWAAADELRQLHPTRISRGYPWLAAGLLATLRWHLHFSRMGIEPILVPLVAAGALWLLLRGWRTHSWQTLLGFGALTALSLYVYQGAWILPLLLAAAWALLAWRARGRIGLLRWAGSAGAAGVALLLALPLLLFALEQPALFLLRPEQIAGGGESGAGQTLGERALAYLLMFVPWLQAGDPDPRRNLPGLAALNFWQALPFWFGAGLAVRHARHISHALPLLLLPGLLLPGVLSEHAPHYHRVLGATAPVALLGGLGLDWIWRRAQPARRAWAGWLSVLLLVAGAGVSARDYFVRWAALPDLFYAFDVGLWEVGRQIAAQPAGSQIYLTPRAADHPTLAFAWSTQPGSHPPPVSFDGRHVLPATAGRTLQPEIYVVLENEDFRTRLLLPELLPDATIVQTITDWQGQVYANSYLRPAGSALQRTPTTAAAAELGDGIGLAGYDAQVAVLESGRILYVQLYWDVAAPPQQEWTTFVHLRGPLPDTTKQVAGTDSVPGGGSLPTRRWQAGWKILDEYQLQLPADLPAGRYQLAVGLYNQSGAQLPDTGGDHTIGEVTLE